MPPMRYIYFTSMNMSGGRSFCVPTLGERSHEEVVEIASHLGELPLAPFPALAHLCGGDSGDGLVGGQGWRTRALQVGGEGTQRCWSRCTVCVCVSVCAFVCVCLNEGGVWVAAAASPPFLTLPPLFPLSALLSTCRALAVNQPAALCPLLLTITEVLFWSLIGAGLNYRVVHM